jgi:hypothetical protein
LLPENELAALCVGIVENRDPARGYPHRKVDPCRCEQFACFWLWVAAGLAFPATAQQPTPRPSPTPAQQDTLCDAFTKGVNGDWGREKGRDGAGAGGHGAAQSGPGG